ncbi:hypothetical protein D0T53_00390 [Dysgonomonas sp. 216]|uniref:oligosaccharide flippase family protein n=1 Tax=Dysgonomonas sp. 216 TaxID=2302934 RepID=UPI0013D10F63|nr:oligosaccharide flippase family protein [Dysgonomonas sp. 216]NDW17372.1 hypothetical protein [Dysgonomonas sp. 216]
MEQEQRLGMGMDMEKKNKGKKLFVFNSFTGLVQLIISAVLIIVCLPVFLKILGKDLYGVFSIVSVIGNLAIYANLSLDAALIKFISEQGKCKESDNDIVVMFLLMLSFLLPLSVLIFLFNDFILLSILSVPTEYLSEGKALLFWLILANLLLLLGKVFTSIVEAKQKIYLTNFASFIYSLIYWGGSAFVLLAGKGLKGVGVTIFVAAVIWFFLVMFAACKNWGRLDLGGLRFQFKASAKKQLKYSTKIYTGSLLSFLYEPLTRILISNFIGIADVGFYDIALRIKSQVLTLFYRLLQPLYPTIAIMKDIAKIRTLAEKLTNGLLFVVIPVVVLLIFCTEPIITLWLKEGNISLISQTTIILIVVNLLFSIPFTPVYCFLRAKNHPEKEVYIQSVNSIVNASVLLIFYTVLGYYSVLLGNGLSIVCSGIMCMYFQYKYLGVLPLDTFKVKLKYILCFCVVFGAAALYSYYGYSISLQYIILQMILVGGVSLLAFYLFKVFDKKDLSLK